MPVSWRTHFENEDRDLIIQRICHKDQWKLHKILEESSMNTWFLQNKGSLAQQLCLNKLFSYMVIKPYFIALITNNILISGHYQYFSFLLMLFFYLFIISGVGLSPLGTAATSGLLY
jgi:hypothetical protein